LTRIIVIALVIAAACLPVRAEDMIGADRTAPPPASEASVPAVLSGTLKQVRERGAVTTDHAVTDRLGDQRARPLGSTLI